MKLVLKRLDGESWLQAAIRLSRQSDLEKEVRDSYRAFRAAGDNEMLAAWHACYDWDLLEAEVGP